MKVLTQIFNSVGLSVGVETSICLENVGVSAISIHVVMLGPRLGEEALVGRHYLVLINLYSAK